MKSEDSEEEVVSETLLSLTNRERAIVENVILAISHKEALELSDCKWLLRFCIHHDYPTFQRPTFFGFKMIPIRELSQDEFNKLHKIANLPWSKK